MEVKLKHITIDKDRHGNERVYFRKRGRPKIRLREKVGSEQFHEEYRCALLGIEYVKEVAPQKAVAPKLGRPAVGTFRWLVQEYMRREVSTQAASTRRQKELRFAEICRLTEIGKVRTPVGDRPYANMTQIHVEEIRDDKAHSPEAANHRVKIISAMFKWAMENKLARHNPAANCKKLDPLNEDGHHTWTEEEIAKFEATHPVGSKARLALTIFRYTGLRVSDVAVFGRQHLYQAVLPDGTKQLRFKIKPKKTSGKTGVEVDFPVLPPLADALESVPKTNMIFLLTEWGRPFSVKGLGNKMRVWCDEAGLPHCSSHGIRKADAVIAAENGATSAQLQAMFGWTNSRQADHYTRAAERKRTATAGAHHLLR
jgi:Phage integrase family.